MRASLYRMAPVWPHGDKQVGPRDTLKAPVPVSFKNDHFRQQYFADGVGQDPISLYQAAEWLTYAWDFQIR